MCVCVCVCSIICDAMCTNCRAVTISGRLLEECDELILHYRVSSTFHGMLLGIDVCLINKKIKKKSGKCACVAIVGIRRKLCTALGGHVRPWGPQQRGKTTTTNAHKEGKDQGII